MNMVPAHIVFRADASLEMGSGHVMRCLTLADALRERGARCSFVCRPHVGHLLQIIADRGHAVLSLPPLAGDWQPADGGSQHALWLGCDWEQDAEQTRLLLQADRADWIVVDHYALDARWEKELRQSCRALMVIDDLADRPHDCDVLLDQNLGRDSADYDVWLAAGVRRLIGPAHALLRPEFLDWRAASLARREQPRLQKVLISMGGVDKDNATGEVLRALAHGLPHGVKVVVVMGPNAPWLSQVQQQAHELAYPVEIKVGVNDMARLMAESDLAIGAAGATAWERCALGLPSIVVVLAENQRPGAQALQRCGAALMVQSTLEFASLWQTGLDVAHPERWLREMSLAARRVTDGSGAPLVAHTLMASHV